MGIEWQDALAINRWNASNQEIQSTISKDITSQPPQPQELVWELHSKMLVSDGRPRDCTGEPRSTEALKNMVKTGPGENLSK